MRRKEQCYERRNGRKEVTKDGKEETTRKGRSKL
jgi:hypothetical protein